MAEAETAVGRVIPQLAQAVVEDWNKIVSLLTEACAHLEALESEGRGLNGTSSTARGARSTLEQVAKTLKAEADETSRKLLAGPPSEPMHEHVDHAHAGRVLAARAET